MVNHQLTHKGTNNIELEKILKIQQSIIKHLTKPGVTLESSLERVIKVICKAFNWHYGTIWLRTEKEQLYYCTHWATQALKNAPLIYTARATNIKPGQGLVGYSYKHKRSKIIYSFGNRPRGQRLAQAYNAYFKAAAAFPIIVDQRVIGVLELFAKKVHKPNPRVLEFLEVVCAQLGQVIKRRQHSEQMAISEEKHRILVEMAPDIIYAVDDNYNVISLNNAVERMIGIKKEELLGRPLHHIFVAEDRKHVQRALEVNRTTNKPMIIQARLSNAYKKEIIAEIVESQKISIGSHVSRLGTIRDITDRLSLEKQKEIWVAMATHELKTPLTSIKAFTQIVQSKEKDEENIKYLVKINRLADSMTNIIDDFLEVTRIKTNELKIQKTNFPLNKTIKDVIYTLSPSTTHEIELKLDKDVHLQADKKRVHQLLYNLITNAIKYSPGTRQIIVRTHVAAKNVLISVTDFGIGIKKDQLKIIFNAFYRSKSKSDTPGLGLGLFIAEAVAKAHKGRIWAESEENKGSTFYVKLPTENLSK